MTNAAPESSEIDANARFPLSLLLAFGLLWLVVSGALALLSYAQALNPTFLADCSVFTFGRTRALQETTLIYGWISNVGFVLALWILGRLGGAPLRSLNWVVVGALFWNVGLTLGLVGIAMGDGSAIPHLHLPAYVQPVLLFAFCAIAVPGILAWTGRRATTTFAAQWYAVAALFLFPWLFSAAQVMIVWAPVRGTIQAIAAGWFVQASWSLWIAPLAIAAAYYLVPKITGRIIPSYDFASLSFWTLLVVGGWTGGRHLIGGPVPAWVATIAIVSTALLLFHYAVTAINLRGAFFQRSISLKFVSIGLLAYVLGGLVDAVTSLRSFAVSTQFTWFTQAQTQLALTGAFSLIAFGAIYFLVPRLFNQAWPSAALIRGHYFASLLGVIGLVVGLVLAGITQGRDLADAAVPFADITTHTRPWLSLSIASQALLLLGNVGLALHFVRLFVGKRAVPAGSIFVQPATMEASVS